jgi:hypothetical protein
MMQLIAHHSLYTLEEAKRRDTLGNGINFIGRGGLLGRRDIDINVARTIKRYLVASIGAFEKTHTPQLLSLGASAFLNRRGRKPTLYRARWSCWPVAAAAAVHRMVSSYSPD